MAIKDDALTVQQRENQLKNISEIESEIAASIGIALYKASAFFNEAHSIYGVETFDVERDATAQRLNSALGEVVKTAAECKSFINSRIARLKADAGDG
jgi:hypothetical protein